MYRMNEFELLQAVLEYNEYKEESISIKVRNILNEGNVQSSIANKTAPDQSMYKVGKYDRDEFEKMISNIDIINKIRKGESVSFHSYSTMICKRCAIGTIYNTDWLIKFVKRPNSGEYFLYNENYDFYSNNRKNQLFLENQLDIAIKQIRDSKMQINKSSVFIKYLDDYRTEQKKELTKKELQSMIMYPITSFAELKILDTGESLAPNEGLKVIYVWFVGSLFSFYQILSVLQVIKCFGYIIYTNNKCYDELFSLKGEAIGAFEILTEGMTNKDGLRKEMINILDKECNNLLDNELSNLFNVVVNDETLKNIHSVYETDLISGLDSDVDRLVSQFSHKTPEKVQGLKKFVTYYRDYLRHHNKKGIMSLKEVDHYFKVLDDIKLVKQSNIQNYILMQCVEKLIYPTEVLKDIFKDDFPGKDVKALLELLKDIQDIGPTDDGTQIVKLVKANEEKKTNDLMTVKIVVVEGAEGVAVGKIVGDKLVELFREAAKKVKVISLRAEEIAEADKDAENNLPKVKSMVAVLLKDKNVAELTKETVERATTTAYEEIMKDHKKGYFLRSKEYLGKKASEVVGWMGNDPNHYKKASAAAAALGAAYVGYKWLKGKTKKSSSSSSGSSSSGSSSKENRRRRRRSSRSRSVKRVSVNRRTRKRVRK